MMSNVWKFVGIGIGITVLFLVMADLYPEMSDAGDSLNESGIPLGSLFAGDGVVFLIVAAGLLFVVLAAVGLHKKYK